MKKLISMSFLIILIVSGTAFSQVGTWIMKADNIELGGGGIAEIDGKIYSMKGCWKNFEYDPTNDIWMAKQQLPLPDCYEASLGYFGGRLFMFGRESGGGIYPTTLEYNPASDSWTQKQNMITARGDSAVATVSGKIYVIGGYRSNSCPGGGGGCPHNITNVNQEYDPINNTWTSKAPMPTPRAQAVAAAVNGKIYVIGGRESSDPNSGGTPTNIVEEYDPVTDNWTTKSLMPTARFSPIGVVMDGKIYIIGGRLINPLGIVECYNPPTDIWTTAFNPLPLRTSEFTQRSAGTIPAIDGKCYVVTTMNVWEFTIPKLKVEIDIKPGSDPNSINLNSAGVIPVAILSSDTFDATRVKPETVSLSGSRIKLVGKSGKYLAHEEDINFDGKLDLVCQVETDQLIIELGQTIVILEAETFDGTQIWGEDNIKIVS